VERPAINRDEGATLAFSKARERKALNAPPEDTIAGLRDRAILSAAPHVRLQRAEIAALTDGDLYQNRGDDSFRVTREYRRAAVPAGQGTTGSGRTSAGAWTRTRSTPWCASMLASSGSTAIRIAKDRSHPITLRSLPAECSGRP